MTKAETPHANTISAAWLNENDLSLTPNSLKDIQANILKFHARRHGAYVFVRFKEGQRKSVQEHLAVTLNKYITSAYIQELLTERYKAQLGRPPDAKTDGEVSDEQGIVMFGLTWKGYVYLGLSDFVPGQGDDDDLDLEWFKAGLGETPKNLPYQFRWDPQKQQWDAEYRDNDIHAVFILADDRPGRLQKTAQALKRSLGKEVQIVAHENVRGRVWRDHDFREPREHFGFRDALSKPREPWKALVKEPAITALEPDTAVDSYGSFLAILKLEQNVQKFRNDAAELAARFTSAGLPGFQGLDAEALAVGRRPDGEPLVPGGASDPGLPEDKIRIFDFAADANGSHCPFHSHIRKMNSRGIDLRKNVEWSPQILRRGMAYGSERQDLARQIDEIAPSRGVGLIFTSFQHTLLEFVSLFHRAYDPDELDALIGRSLGQQVKPQTWLKNNTKVQHLMADFVNPKGGEYFFAPSMRLIRNLDKLCSSV